MSTLDPLMVELRVALTAIADPERVPAMTAYMKDHFPFLGVSSPARRPIVQDLARAAKGWSSEQLLSFADACWAEPEREFQHVAMDVLRRRVGLLSAVDVSRVEHLIRTKSWWDTVDALASDVVGPLVAAHPELATAMDRWIDDADFWIARTALLHQLKFRERTDAARLFAYVERRAGDTEFFIRKACGWALRQYASVDPDAVRAFVAAHHEQLSGLTRREALKHLSPQGNEFDRIAADHRRPEGPS
jgi:3-methyladenine DNA glycosylase AlkD